MPIEYVGHLQAAHTTHLAAVSMSLSSTASMLSSVMVGSTAKSNNSLTVKVATPVHVTSTHTHACMQNSSLKRTTAGHKTPLAWCECV